MGRDLTSPFLEERLSYLLGKLETIGSRKPLPSPKYQQVIGKNDRSKRVGLTTLTVTHKTKMETLVDICPHCIASGQAEKIDIQHNRGSHFVCLETGGERFSLTTILFDIPKSASLMAPR